LTGELIAVRARVDKTRTVRRDILTLADALSVMDGIVGR
jgi:hypothetical protein